MHFCIVRQSAAVTLHCGCCRIYLPALCVLQASCSVAVTGVFYQLHLLPIWQRVIFKIAGIMYR